MTFIGKKKSMVEALRQGACLGSNEKGTVFAFRWGLSAIALFISPDHGNTLYPFKHVEVGLEAADWDITKWEDEADEAMQENAAGVRESSMAQKVAELRQKTEAPVETCREALLRFEGDVGLAEEAILRKGLA